MNVELNRQLLCNLCPSWHEVNCRCTHLHHQHNFAGGCIVCWEEFKRGKRKREDVCECYDQRLKKKLV